MVFIIGQVELCPYSLIRQALGLPEEPKNSLTI